MQERGNVRNNDEKYEYGCPKNMDETTCQLVTETKFGNIHFALIDDDDSVVFPCQQTDSIKVVHNKKSDCEKKKNLIGQQSKNDAM